MVSFDPPDYYGTKYKDMQTMFAIGKKPFKSDVLEFRKNWFTDQCNRKKFKDYYTQVFGPGSCKGSGKAEYIVVSRKNDEIGTHVLCKKCLDEYISKSGPYKKKGDALVSKKRMVYIYEI